MPLPTATDETIRNRFESLLTESEQLIEDMVRESNAVRKRRVQSGIISFSEPYVLEDSFYALRMKFLSLLQLLSPYGEHIARSADEVRALENTPTDAARLVGTIRGLKDDYESGMLERLTAMIEANVAADYLGQAEQLLKEGKVGQFDHVPAAVLLGAILEDALRRLCKRQTPPVPATKAGGDPKMLNSLIDDLKKAGVFNELKAKQLRAWADIRNAAAHGEFDKFQREDVEQMMAGVQNFLASHL